MNGEPRLTIFPTPKGSEHAIRQQWISQDQSLKEELEKKGVDIGVLNKSVLKDVIPNLAIVFDEYKDGTVSEKAFDQLLYLARNRSSDFFETVANLLDFENPAHFDQTESIIRTLWSLHNDLVVYEDETIESSNFFGRDGLSEAAVNTFSQGSSTVVNVIETALKEKNGNYILNRRAQELLHLIKPDEHLLDPSEDNSKNQPDPPSVRKITASLYGYVTGGKVLVTPAHKYDLVDRKYGSYINNDASENRYRDSANFSGRRVRGREAELEGLCTQEVTAEDLLLQNKMTLPEKESANALKDYAYLMSNESRNIVEKDFDVDLSSLTIKEQGYFLQYLRHQTVTAAEQLQAFSKKFNINGLRTFLVTADDENLRKKVFAFAESVSPEDAQKVFAVYGKLVGSIDDVEEYLREAFGAENTIASQAIVEQLLSRARTLLAQAYEYRETPEKLVELTKNRQLENALFLESFRALKQLGSIPNLEDVKYLELRTYELRDQSIPEEDKKTMRAIAEKNYASYREGLRAQVLQSLIDAMASKNTRFHLLRYKGDIVGFVRFDERPTGTNGRPRRYAGSLNIDFDFRSSKLGEVMMEQTIMKEAESSILEAVCDADKQLTEKYIELGFIATRYWVDNETPTLDIEFDVENNKKLKTRMMSREQVIRSADSGAVSPSYRLIVSNTRPNLSNEFREGEILTRYFSTKDSRGVARYYVAFERSRA